jgi:CheY-like chemotaxis protein
MDCDMPVMDGLTAVREIRKMEAAGELPGSNRIYAITANAREGQIEAAKDAGMDGVIVSCFTVIGQGLRLTYTRADQAV